MTTRLKVAVLFGGRSGEHEVSLVSAASVAAGLAGRHDVRCVLIDKAGRWLLQEGPEPRPAGGEPVFLAPVPGDGGRLRRLSDARELARPDVFFPVLHGTYGEDGTVQGLLELAAVPYVGAGVAASAAAMDKAMMKAPVRAGRAPPGRAPRAARGATPARRRAPLRRARAARCFVKPANLGSSVGVSEGEDGRGPRRPPSTTAFAYDRKVVVEKGIDAREIEVAVLGNDAPEASVPGEVVPDREFYDYDSKYVAGRRHRAPHPRADRRRRHGRDVRRLATAAFQARGRVRASPGSTSSSRRRPGGSS